MANGIFSTLNPKLSYTDTVLILFQTVRGHGGARGGARGVTWVRRATVTLYLTNSIFDQKYQIFLW